MSEPKKVGILLFPDVDVLDFAGPFEVFSVTGEQSVKKKKPFHVFTVAATSDPIIARHGLSVNPKHTFDDCPQLDILIVPGGQGSRKTMEHYATKTWIRSQYPKTDYILSVCTGALILGSCGLLDGLHATTHHTALDELRSVAPTAKVIEDQRVVANGDTIVSAGVSAGIDASLFLVDKILGRSVAVATATEMEYYAPFLEGDEELTARSIGGNFWPGCSE